MDYTKKTLQQELAELEDENVLKRFLGSVIDPGDPVIPANLDASGVIEGQSASGNSDKESNSATPSYMEWLKKNGYVDDDADEYVSKGAQADHDYQTAKAARAYSDALFNAGRNREKASIAANVAYSQALSNYGTRASYLDRLGFTDGGTDQYYKTEAYRKYRDEVADAERSYLNALQNAAENKYYSDSKAERDLITQTEKENAAYLKAYNSEVAKAEKEAAEAESKTKRTQNYYEKMNDYYYTYRRNQFNEGTLYERYLSGKVSDGYYNDFVKRYNEDFANAVDGLFDGTIEENDQAIERYRNDPLLNGRNKKAAEQAYEESKRVAKAVVGKIITSVGNTVGAIQGANGTSFEKLMPYIKNTPGTKPFYISIKNDTGSTVYRVANFDMLGSGKNRSKAEELIKSYSYDGKAVLVNYDNRTYVTDGKEIFRLVYVR